MDLLSQIMNYGDLPQWAQSRLSIAFKDLGDKKNHFFLEYLHFDEENSRNNTGIAWFLTEDEIVNVVFTLEMMRIAKHKLAGLVRVHKNISTSIDHACKDVCVQIVTLEFLEGKKIVINPPRYEWAGANESYIKFTSRF